MVDVQPDLDLADVGNSRAFSLSLSIVMILRDSGFREVVEEAKRLEDQERLQLGL